MSLSLEVRKFINSENIGSFVTVTLPSELPVDDAEIRAVRRDKAAAEKASREAQDREDAEKLAERTVAGAERELQNANAELARLDKTIEEAQSSYELLLVPHAEKKKAAESARAVLDEKRGVSDALENELDAAELAFSRAQRSHNDAEKKLDECKTSLEKAKIALRSAELEETELVEKLDALKSELASMEVLADKADGDVSALKSLQNEQEKAYEILNEESLALAVERRMLEKQLNEAIQAEARASKNCQRAKSEHLAAEQQLEMLKSRNLDKDAAKLAQVKSRLEAAATDEGARLAEHEKEEKALQAAKERFDECDRRVIENAEKKRAAQQLLFDAKSNTKSVSDARLSESSRLASKRSDETALEKRLDKIKLNLSAAKRTREDAENLSRQAEQIVSNTKHTLDDATAKRDIAKQRYDAALELSEESRKLYDEKKAEFDKDDALVDAAKTRLDTLKSDKAALKESISKIEAGLNEAQSRLTSARRNHLSASTKAKDLNGSIHVIEAKYERARMHYLESGKGEPLILIHTAGQSLFTFRNVFYKLAMYYRVIAIDLVGHGYSDRPDFFDYSVSCHAESILGFMNELGIERAHLLGFSMGAGYALELARRHPDRVGSVVALSPGGVTSSMPLMIRMIESGILGPIASRLYKIRNVEKMLDECLFDHTVIGSHELDQYFRPASDPQGRWAIRRTVSGYNEKALLTALRDLDTPVLIACGEEDRWHSVEDGQLYEGALANATLTVVRNAGHLLHEEKPDKIVALVRSIIPAGYGDDD